MINSLLYAEVNGACVLILILLAVKLKKSAFVQRERILFLRLIQLNIVFFILDSIWVFVDNSAVEMMVSVNWIINAMYFIYSGILGFAGFDYSETVQNSKLVTNKKYRIISQLPMILLIVMTLLSIKTGWIFYIDSNNVYHRGQLYVVQLIIAYGYVVFTALKAFYISGRIQDYQRKSELRTLSTFAIPTLIASILQVVTELPFVCVGTTFGILYIHVTLQERLISQDPLTKLNNRNQLRQYLSGKLANTDENRILYLLIMDIDYFKSINDEYGHVEGDNALKHVADSLRRVCNDKHYFISRYGGDEFVLICELSPTDQVQMVCDAIHNEMKKLETPYVLSLSVGYAKYTPDIKTQSEFIAKADEELYKVKKNRK